MYPEFEELGVELPVTTRFVISLAAFITDKWYLAILLVGLFIAGIVASFKTKKGKSIFDKMILKVPIVSDLLRKTSAATTARTLSSLISAGVPITKALEVTSRVVGNVHFRAALQDVSKNVQKGEKLSFALSRYEHLYPPLVIQMIEVGEETGQTSEILLKLADFFEEEVSNVTENMASVIEPILMLIIGGVVGFFAISMVQPMYSMLGGV